MSSSWGVYGDDVQRIMILPGRLAANSRVMHDTLERLFDAPAESAQDLADDKECAAMNEQITLLGTDVADLKNDVGSIRLDVGGLKLDVSILKSDVSGLKLDVSILKSDVSVLKSEVNALKLDTAVIRGNYATRSDVSEAKSAVILSCVGSMIAMTGLAFAVARWVV